MSLPDPFRLFPGALPPELEKLIEDFKNLKKRVEESPAEGKTPGLQGTLDRLVKAQEQQNKLMERFIGLFEMKPAEGKPDRMELYRLYWDRSFPERVIGYKYGVDRATVQKWLESYDIPLRPSPERSTLTYKNEGQSLDSAYAYTTTFNNYYKLGLIDIKFDAAYTGTVTVTKKSGKGSSFDDKIGEVVLNADQSVLMLGEEENVFYKGDEIKLEITAQAGITADILIEGVPS